MSPEVETLVRGSSRVLLIFTLTPSLTDAYLVASLLPDISEMKNEKSGIVVDPRPSALGQAHHSISKYKRFALFREVLPL